MNISLTQTTAQSTSEARKPGTLVLPAAAPNGTAIGAGMADFGLAYDNSAEPFTEKTQTPESEPEPGKMRTGQKPAKNVRVAEPKDIDTASVDHPRDNGEESCEPHRAEAASRPAVTDPKTPKSQAAHHLAVTDGQLATDRARSDETSEIHTPARPEPKPQLQTILTPPQDRPVLPERRRESHYGPAQESPALPAKVTEQDHETIRQPVMATNLPHPSPQTTDGDMVFTQTALPLAKRADRPGPASSGPSPEPENKNFHNRPTPTEPPTSAAAAKPRETFLERAVTGQMGRQGPETRRSSVLRPKSDVIPLSGQQSIAGNRPAVAADQQLDQPVIPMGRNGAPTRAPDTADHLKIHGEVPPTAGGKGPQPGPSTGDATSRLVQPRETPMVMPRQPEQAFNAATQPGRGQIVTDPVTAISKAMDRSFNNESRQSGRPAPVAISAPVVNFPQGSSDTAKMPGVRRSEMAFDHKGGTGQSQLMPQAADRPALNPRPAAPVSGSAPDAAAVARDHGLLLSVSHHEGRRASAASHPPERAVSSRDATLPQTPNAESPPRAALAAPASTTGPEAAKTDTAQSVVEPNRLQAADGYGGPRVEVMHTSTAHQTTPPHRADLPVQVARQLAEAFQNTGQRPVDIALNPEELGRVRLALSATESGMVIHVTAERPDTIELMRRHIAELTQEFRQIGYSNVSLSFAGGDTGQGDRTTESPSRPPESGADAGPENPVEIILSSAPETGIDIRL